MPDLQLLLKQRQENEHFRNRVIAALVLHYDFVDPLEHSCRESATAGNVYSYLALILKEVETHVFRKKVLDALTSCGLVVPGYTNGRVWLRGLIAKDPTQDRLVAQATIEQHYQDRKRYRERQRQHALKRRRAPERT